MDDGGKRVIIAANPKSGRGSSAEKISQLHQAASDIGFEVEVIHSLDEVQEKSRIYAAEKQLRTVIAAGGDGTADVLANLLAPEVPMLLMPLGTENLLAKYLGITGDIRQACAALQAGELRPMDVGSANGTLFLVMLSCGFDAQVVQEMHAIRRGHITRWSYTRPIFKSLASYGFPQVQMTDDTGQVGRGAWVFIFNVPRYAAGLEFCPQADPHDGQLDVCTFSRGGVAFGMGYLLRLFLRSHQSMKGFSHQLCRKISLTVESTNHGARKQKDVPYQIDGDPGGRTPLEVKVLPNRLTLLVPPQG